MLCEAGADIDLGDKQGKGPMGISASCNPQSVISCLSVDKVSKQSSLHIVLRIVSASVLSALFQSIRISLYVTVITSTVFACGLLVRQEQA